MRPGQLSLLLLMNFFWAAIYSANKVMGQTLPVGAIVTLRFGLAAVSLLVIWPWIKGACPRRRDLVVSAGLGILVFVVGQRLQVYGNNLGTAGNSSVLMAVEPLLTSLAAALLLREKIGPRRLAGFLIALAGVAILAEVWRKDFQWASLGASLIFLSSFVCEAIYSVMGKSVSQKASPLKMVAVSLAAGTVVNVMIDGRATWHAAQKLAPSIWVLLLLMAVVCTALGYVVWFVVIRDCPISVAALTIFAQSLFGVFIAAIWLREPLHFGQLWGGVAILAGLALGLSRQIKTVPEEQTATNASAPE